MPHISISDLSVTFNIYGANSRSLKKQLVSTATGGRVVSGANDAVSVRALNNINLEIRDGERIGLVGHNGSGKSTLLRTLAGIYKPTRGKIEISGTIGALLDPHAGMEPDATGIENIFLRGYVLGMSDAQIRANIEEIADFTELGNFLNLPLRTYSAGMFARLAFAVSTTIRPQILLMDEGIGAGDEAFKEKMKARLSSFVGEANILILASHDTTLMDRFCDRRIQLEHGQMIEVETPAKTAAAESPPKVDQPSVA